MKLPLTGYVITQRFGERLLDYSKFGLMGHNGIDFGCGTGTEIRSVEGGVIQRARNDLGGYGLHVKISHAGGISTLYGHLSSILVKEGQRVEEGDLLGLSGNTGNSTGAHLHFEVRKAGEEGNGYGGAVDPLTMIDSQPAPEPEPAPLPAGTAKVIANRLNVRLEPNLQGECIGGVTYGDVLKVAGDDRFDGEINWLPVVVWVAIERNGNRFLEVGQENHEQQDNAGT